MKRTRQNKGKVDNTAEIYKSKDIGKRSETQKLGSKEYKKNRTFQNN